MCNSGDFSGSPLCRPWGEVSQGVEDDGAIVVEGEIALDVLAPDTGACGDRPVGVSVPSGIAGQPVVFRVVIEPFNPDGAILDLCIGTEAVKRPARTMPDGSIGKGERVNRGSVEDLRHDGLSLGVEMGGKPPPWGLGDLQGLEGIV